MRVNLLLLTAALLVACGGDGSGDDGATNATSTGATGSSAASTGSEMPEAGPFDACGGKIVGSSGAISADEYKSQASSWDRATIDCRLGPKYDFYHPGDADKGRPTAMQLPLTDNPSAYLCPQFDHDTAGPAGYGSTSGQVAYAPDAAADPGLDRLQTVGWEGSGMCFQPLEGSWTGGPHPDPAVTEWGAAVAGAVPIAKARTEHAETGDGIVVFSNGFIGATGTQTSGSTHPSLQLPPNKVPFAVAITNYNEFALVAVWDTDKIAGELAVIALRAPKPESFSVNLFGAPNEGGFDALQLLGYVELPDITTPTAIAVAGNNQGHNGPWVQSGTHAYKGVGTVFADLSYAGMTSNDASYVWTSDPTTGPGFFATAGGAIIASQWEGKATFIDLAPLFQFVRSVYVEPIQNHDNEALYTSATGAGPWPFDFTTNPEMKPTVVTTVQVADPRVVRYGIQPTPNTTGLQSKTLAWVGALDGRVTAFDVSSLSGLMGTANAPIAEVGHVMADPNPTSMHLADDDDALFLSSRGNRSVQWIAAGPDAITVTETLRDSRLDDPVATDHNQRVGVITVGDFSGGEVLNFERDDASCADAGGGARTCDYSFDGSLKLPGAVYLVDTANVN